MAAVRADNVFATETPGFIFGALGVNNGINARVAMSNFIDSLGLSDRANTNA